MAIRSWSAVLAGSCAAAVAYVLASSWPGALYALYDGMALTAVAATVLGARRQAPEARRPWYLLAWGIALFAAGDLVYTGHTRLWGQPPFPSVADVGYLGGYPFLAAGLVLMVRRRIPDGDWAGLLDALILATGLGVLAWVFLIAPYAFDAALSAPARLVAVAYPLMDVVLVGIALRIIMAGGSRATAYQLLCGGVGLFLLTDILYGVMVLAGTYSSGSPLDTGYVVAYGLLGAAALHPSAPQLTLGEVGSSQRLTRGRLAALMAASLLAPIVGTSADDSALQTVTRGASAVLFLLVIARMALLLRALEKASAQRAVLEDELRHQALHDPLTGLANRVLFTDRVEQGLRRMARRPLKSAVLFLDVDDFKTVNDSLGHGAGDDLLAAVSARVGSCIRPVDTAARIGGDEFAVLLEDLDGVAEAVAVAERIIEGCREPVKIQGRHVTGSVSVGVAMVESHQDAEVVLRNADLAMYRAKHRGKDQWELYEPGMHMQVLARLDLKADLQSALSSRQFELWYQPVVRLEGGVIVGAEALLRWRHPSRGLLSPEEFVPLAEETGAIVPLGRWVLEESCARASGWQQRYPDEPFTISVNVSPVQLREPGLVDDVVVAVADAELDPHRLLLELTEGVFVRDTEPTLEVLRELRGLGVRIAIDDFGTGYSSLSYLQHFPIDVIKVDKSFVEALGKGPHEAALARGVFLLARTLGATTVAEGIETASQRADLLAMGCPLGQGYHFTRPLSREGFDTLLARGGRVSVNRPTSVETEPRR